MMLLSRSTTTARRPRVVLVQDPFVRRNQVREVLEDGGFEVIAETPARHVLGAIADHRPDAVVLDERFVSDRPPDTVSSIRAVSPFTQIVVFSSAFKGTSEGRVDGYVDKLVQTNGNLTGLLSRLLDERAAAPLPPAPPLPRAWDPLEDPGTSVWRTELKRSAVKILAIALTGSLVTWAGVSSIRRSVASPPAGPKHRHHQQHGASGIAAEPTALHLAFADLTDLRRAIVHERWGLVPRIAQRLVVHRYDARQAGWSVKRLDARIGRVLAPLIATIPTRVLGDLRDVLGKLVPVVPATREDTSLSPSAGPTSESGAPPHPGLGTGTQGERDSGGSGGRGGPGDGGGSGNGGGGSGGGGTGGGSGGGSGGSGGGSGGGTGGGGSTGGGGTGGGTGGDSGGGTTGGGSDTGGGTDTGATGDTTGGDTGDSGSGSGFTAPGNSADHRNDGGNGNANGGTNGNGNEPSPNA